MAKCRNRFRFFALPAEIRNQIMEYVLIPGDVYARPSKNICHAQQSWIFRSSRLRRFLKAMSSLFPDYSRHEKRALDASIAHLEGPSVVQPSGFQLLATCKQAYNDGHYIFYTMNSFHFPHGPNKTDADAWYSNLQPKLRKLIKTICVPLNLIDLTEEGMDAIEYAASRRHRGRPGDYNGSAWGHEFMIQLQLRMWFKIMSLFCPSHRQNLHGFGGLEQVIISSPFGQHVLKSQRGLHVHETHEANEFTYIEQFIGAVSRKYKRIIRSHVERIGWKKTKKWWEELWRKQSRA